VQEDETLLVQANERLRALGLDWHGDQTDSVIRFRNTAAGSNRLFQRMPTAFG